MPYYNRDPKRDHNFDIPCAFVVQDWLGTLGSRRAHRSLASAARSQIWGAVPKIRGTCGYYNGESNGKENGK